MSTPVIETKYPKIGTTIFTGMSALASEHQAVNLGQGFPDFDCDPRLVQCVSDAMQRGLNQYPPMTGVPVLREVIAEKIQRLYGYRYDAGTDITVTAGATQAIFTALLAIVHPGDEVIVFQPVYDSYLPIIRQAGGIPRLVRLEPPHWRITEEALRKAKEELEARVQGFLEAITYRDGAVVKKGAPLFSIQRNTYEAQLKQAQGALDTAKAAGADVLLMVGNVGPSAQVVKSLDRMGWKVPVVSHWGPAGGRFTELAGPSAKEVHFVQTYSFFGNQRPVGQKVLKALMAKYPDIKGAGDVTPAVGVANGVYESESGGMLTGNQRKLLGIFSAMRTVRYS